MSDIKPRTSEIAAWLMEYVRDSGRGWIDRYALVPAIEERWGAEWVSETEAGQPALLPKVYTAWRKLPDYKSAVTWDAESDGWYLKF